MCGIIGYVGKKRAAPLLLDGLKKLEYRGYDSAGIVLLDGGRFVLCKKTGRVERLKEARGKEGHIGVGHTRWATHGRVSEENAHPHIYGKFAIVHNGIIENAERLKEEYGKGVTFLSETDSEVIAVMLQKEYDGNIFSALSRVAKKLKGSFALAILCSDFPENIFLCKRKSPLLVGEGEGECFAASDFPALFGKGLTVYLVEEGETVVLSQSGAVFLNDRGEWQKKSPIRFDWKESEPSRGSYPFFMRKEIEEIPAAMERTAAAFQSADRSALDELLKGAKSIHFVGCGTAYHACLVAANAFERLLGVECRCFLASEYRYLYPVGDPLVVATSQSGETADTLACVELAKSMGRKVLGVTNVSCSTLARTADFSLFTSAGQEIAVAATKSYNAQLALFFLLAEEYAKIRPTAGEKGLFPDREAEDLPALARETIRRSEEVRGWIGYFSCGKPAFFLGRGVDYAVAREGALKLKEIAYLPCEGLAAGELKHGTLALIGEDTPVVVLINDESLVDKTLSGVEEVRSRGGIPFVVTQFEEVAKKFSRHILLPPVHACLSPALSVIPLQMLAYYTSLSFGYDPDKPRNLAKSVTVE